MQEIAVIACRWVSDERLAQVEAETFAISGEHLPKLNVYPGSVRRLCQACSEAVWVGPRQQTMLEVHPRAVVMCMLCALRYAVQHGDTNPDIRSLGNPHKRDG